MYYLVIILLDKNQVTKKLSLLKLVLNPAYEGEDIYASDYIPEKGGIGNCMSTSSKTNGAVAIFYPGVAKTFCQAWGRWLVSGIYKCS